MRVAVRVTVGEPVRVAVRVIVADGGGEPVRVGVQFARAVIARDGARADEARAILEARYGKPGLITLGLALCAAQLYPTFKWAIGYGHACQRLQVDNVTITPHHAVA